MRFSTTVVLAVLTVAFATPALAELQNVEVGGSLRIRGNWYDSASNAAPGRPVGNWLFPRPNAIFEDSGHNLSFVESWTRLNVTADFTNDVSAFIELDSYDVWGEDFRGGTLTGLDGRQGAFDDVEVYQAYIETRETFGYPVTVRIGRQELQFGSEWLVGNNDTSSFYRGLSFDGITIRYDADTWNVTGFWTKLFENSGGVAAVEEDGDIDFYGIYASYTGFEDWTIDAYWLFLRDGRGSRLGFFNNTGTGTAAVPGFGVGVGAIGANIGLAVTDAIEDWFGVDQFDDTQKIHTFGLRGAGTYGNWDFEGEIAYQTGDASNVTRGFFTPAGAFPVGGALFGLAGFVPLAFGPGLVGYSNDSADYDNLGLNAEVGYTFDTTYQPRVYLGVAFFEGEDERKTDFWEFVRALFPFYEDQESVSFNRLFSDWEYSEFIDASDLSNVLILRGGVSAKPTENTEVLLAISWFQADENARTNGLFGIPFWGRSSDDDLGWEVGLYLTYNYSEDLTFKVGYAHFFANDGVDNNNFFLGDIFFVPGGNFVNGNGIFNPYGSNNDDANYVFFETSIAF